MPTSTSSSISQSVSVPRERQGSKLQTIQAREDANAVIIIVPGPFGASGSSWGIWIRNLPKGSASKTAIYSFDYEVRSGLSATPQSLLDLGEELVLSLVSLQTTFEGQLPPVVLIAHSLGGVIVKQAFRSISKHFSHVRQLGNAIAAIVFLGTPHGRSASSPVWARALPLLRQRRAFSRRISYAEEDLEKLSTLCVKFEDAASALPILSINETQEAKLGSKSLPFSRSKALIVGRAAGTTNAGRERLLDSHTDHFGLYEIDINSPVYENINDFCEEAIILRADWIQAQKTTAEFLSASIVASSSSSSRKGTRSRSSRQRHSSARSLSAPMHPQVFSPLALQSTINSPAVDGVSLDPWSPRIPFYYVPYERNFHFLGRQDVLREIRDHLLPSGLPEHDLGLKTYAICGPGGIGKTQTAAEFALTHTERFDAILWMRAENHAKLANDFNKVAVALGLVEEGSLDAKDLAVTRELVKGWLNRPRRFSDQNDRLIENTANWLLIFDNADVPEVLYDFWPPVGSVGSVLVTSRDIKAKTSAYGVADGLDLKPFSTEEGARLMMKLTKREDQPGPASRVARALRGYPLALTQMSGVILKGDLSFDQFLAVYDPSEGSDGFSHARATTSTYQHTVATVFAFEQLSKMGRRLLIFLSLIDSDISEEHIIEPILGVITSANFPNTAFEYEQAREELTGKSLAMHNRRTRTLSVNILVQDAALFRISSFDIVPIFHFAVRVLSKLWPVAGADAIRQDNRRWEQCEKLSQHALRLKDRFSKQSDEVRDELALNTQFASLLNEVGWYLQERGQSLYAMDCFRVARNHLEKIIAHDQAYTDGKQQTYPRQLPDLFNSLGHTNTSRALEHGPDDTSFLLAETYRNLGTSAADICDVKTVYDNYVKYKELMIEQLGDDDCQTDPRLAIAYLELAVAHAFKLEYKESKSCSEVALALCESIPLPEMVMNLRTLAVANLALALLELGDAAGARDKALQALQEREERLGPDDRSSMLTGRLLHALGNIYLALDETERSLSYHMRAMIHYKETVGPTHHRTADMCFKVAQHKYRTGHLDEAKKYLEDAHKIYQTQKQHYKAERARVLHWKAKLVPVGEDQSVKLRIAADLLKSAQDQRGVKGTTADDSDFDEMVVFWSR
ncbi:hypothetical protein CB0940_10839 [Cercospora beticola]|uniref:Uncharacterized protein n=1 Tax=Cercospora beticola TaxID=122368 RepID=A0A2G5HUS3_CERBT|nr:hypothetical protein CB0940_10839 [Cercospora beticola]PIA96290.1 hypothetical protein CB0940_10839 [Cercospora beticola]WPB07571.1 hypothetical protein RHO25_012232 [Cercospora beticola]